MMKNGQVFTVKEQSVNNEPLSHDFCFSNSLLMSQ